MLPKERSMTKSALKFCPKWKGKRTRIKKPRLSVIEKRPKKPKINVSQITRQKWEPRRPQRKRLRTMILTQAVLLVMKLTGMEIVHVYQWNLKMTLTTNVERKGKGALFLGTLTGIKWCLRNAPKPVMEKLVVWTSSTDALFSKITGSARVKPPLLKDG